MQTLPLAHLKAVLPVTISADGSTIASVGADDKASLCSPGSGIAQHCFRLFRWLKMCFIVEAEAVCVSRFSLNRLPGGGRETA